jgi:hypothetical protein
MESLKQPAFCTFVFGYTCLRTIATFLAAFALWIPGAILISKASEKNTENTLYLIGFIFMMVVAAVTFLAACLGTCEAVVLYEPKNELNHITIVPSSTYYPSRAPKLNAITI